MNTEEEVINLLPSAHRPKGQNTYGSSWMPYSNARASRTAMFSSRSYGAPKNRMLSWSSIASAPQPAGHASVNNKKGSWVAVDKWRTFELMSSCIHLWIVGTMEWHVVSRNWSELLWLPSFPPLVKEDKKKQKTRTTHPPGKWMLETGPKLMATEDYFPLMQVTTLFCVWSIVLK